MVAQGVYLGGALHSHTPPTSSVATFGPDKGSLEWSFCILVVFITGNASWGKKRWLHNSVNIFTVIKFPT
jgi:hypothetical protein